MKKLIAALSIVVATITLGLSQTGTNNHWVINITNQTSRAQLDSISVTLKKENIYLVISTAEYSNGQLVKLKGSVNMNGPKGTPSATFASDHLASYEITLDKNPAKVMVKGK